MYMIQSESYTFKEFQDEVCTWQRSINGLNQASKIRNMRFDKEIISYDFIKNDGEPCVYRKIIGSIILLVKNDVGMLPLMKRWLSKKFPQNI